MVNTEGLENGGAERGFSEAELKSYDSFERLRMKNRTVAIGRRAFYVIISILLCVLFAVACMYLFFNIDTVKFAGNETFGSEELAQAIDASDITNIFLINKNEITKKLMIAFPYIREVSVKRRFPTTLEITVTEDKPAYYTEISGEFFIISETLRVLERNVQSDERTSGDKSLIRLTMPPLTSAIVGQKLQYVRESNYNYMLSLMSDLSVSDYADRINTVNVDDKYGIYLIIDDGQYKIILGDNSEIPAKLNFVTAIIDTALEKDINAKINIEYVESAIVTLSNTRFE